MGVKVTFHPDTRIIQVDVAPVDGIIDLDFGIDIYSDGKEDWITTPSLTYMTFPIRTVGGDPRPGGFLDATYFLDPTWKIRPYEGNHWFRLVGNLFAEDGSNPYVATIGTYNVQTTNTVSSIVTQVEGSGAAGDEMERDNTVYTVLTKNANGQTLTAKLEKYTDNTKAVLESTRNITITYDGADNAVNTHEMVNA